MTMKSWKFLITAGTLALCSAAALLGQQTAQETKNRQLALNWYREVIVARHVDLANKYMSDDFAEHSANVSGGRADFVAYYGKTPAKPIQAALSQQPYKIIAKGDYVVLVWEIEGTAYEIEDETATGKKYKYNNFDVVRIANGKIAEHWDSLLKDQVEPHR
jgi:predicted SnoaL-like aldol condensation-catalyzing enzyme